MFKTALFDRAISEKCCRVDGGQGICPQFRPHPGGFDSSRIPTPGNLPSKAKKMLMPGGQPEGGGLDAAGIDSCISMICANQIRIQYPGQLALSKLPEEAWNVR